MATVDEDAWRCFYCPFFFCSPVWKKFQLQFELKKKLKHISWVNVLKGSQAWLDPGTEHWYLSLLALLPYVLPSFSGSTWWQEGCLQHQAYILLYSNPVEKACISLSRLGKNLVVFEWHLVNFEWLLCPSLCPSLKLLWSRVGSALISQTRVTCPPLKWNQHQLKHVDWECEKRWFFRMNWGRPIQKRVSGCRGERNALTL